MADAQTPVFSATTEMWRDIITSNAEDFPPNFELAWIDRESGGNPCDYTSMHESGIFQLDPGNMATAGTDEATLRAACTPGVTTRKTFADLTPDQQQLQVSSGMQYLKRARDVARAHLASVGASWDESSADFWKMVKLVHTLPSLLGGLDLAAQDLGRPPASWDEFAPYALTMYGGPKWIPNADWVGQYGEGGGASVIGRIFSGSSLTITLLLGIAAGAWIAYRRAEELPLLPWV